LSIGSLVYLNIDHVIYLDDVHMYFEGFFLFVFKKIGRGNFIN